MSASVLDAEDSSPYYIATEDGAEQLLGSPRTATRGLSAKLTGRAATFLVTSGLLSMAAALVWVISSASSGTTVFSSAPAKQWHGVSLGGWLVMEINPAQRTPTSPMDLRPQVRWRTTPSPLW